MSSKFHAPAPGRVAVIALSLVSLLACNQGQEGAVEGERAMALLEGRSGHFMSGAAIFSRAGSKVALELYVSGAPPGSHGIHLHEVPDCTAPDASSAGGHWNPTGASHGDSHHGEHHRGDVGNLEVAPDGTGSLRFVTDAWTLDANTETSVLGHALIVHAGPDDMSSQPAGNAGPRIGCGVVRPLETDGPPPAPAAPERQLTVNLWPRSGTGAYGTATFTQTGGKVVLDVAVANVSPGAHGLHLHQIGDCSAPDATSAGGHWNPESHEHGAPDSEHHHLGDLGNITVAENGEGTLHFETSEWVVDGPLIGGKRAANDVVGRAFILHAGTDDLTSQPVGNAGGRIACGVVGIDALPPTTAVARVDARSGSTVTGNATFTKSADGVTIKLDIAGASPGLHGVHIHEKGDCSAPDGTSAGGHWNPTGSAHGAPDGAAHHLGDVGNLLVNADGTGTLTYLSKEWDLVGDHGVVGRGLIFHALADDLTSQPVGNAGGRQGCAVITLDGQQPKVVAK